MRELAKSGATARRASVRAALVGVAFTLMLAAAAGCSSSNSSSGSCSTDSSVSCVSGTSGWSCSGDAQPPDGNPDLVCSADGAGDFCCSTSTCSFDGTVPCVSGATGYSCATGAVPPDQNDSTLVCSVPTTANNVDEYCCFTNTATPTGSTCEQDPSVSGCVANASGNPSYGFSCTGSENPQTDYSSITCSTSGTQGTDSQGAPATLYCCVYN